MNKSKLDQQVAKAATILLILGAAGMFIETLGLGFAMMIQLESGEGLSWTLIDEPLIYISAILLVVGACLRAFDR